MSGPYICIIRQAPFLPAKVTKVSRAGSDSREGATINTVANYFHAQISTTNSDERKELLSTIQQQRQESEKGLDVLPAMFVKDDGAGSRFPAMKESPSRTNDDDDFGAPKGRRRESESLAAVGAGQEVAHTTEIADSAPAAAAKPEFDLIRL